jgi:nicotinamidase-related amidase
MTSALLVMDVQQGVAESVGPSLLDRVAEALAAAREASLPVIFVRVAFRPGLPEISPANRTFSTLAGTAGDRFAESSPSTQIHPAVAPRPGEPIVVKKRAIAWIACPPGRPRTRTPQPGRGRATRASRAPARDGS